ncbi:asparagine synthase C-terminal domain-containing protein [Plantactinospora sonchi]|uniref:Asparagine synthase-related protein n=1 Tax=Plantactinospora sonchi TaxID=1544735 RepID=A0ABU7S3T0_9ACTN
MPSPTSAWFLAATAPVPGFEVARIATPPGSPQVYATTPVSPAGTGLTWHAGLGAAPGVRADRPTTRVEVGDDRFVVDVAPMNEVPLYLVKDRFRGRLLVCSDMFVAAAARARWNLPDDPGRPDLLSREGATPCHGVTRLDPGSVTVVRRTGRGWALATEQRPDPLDAAHGVDLVEPAAAGEAFVQALAAAVTGAAAGRPVATLLSGGIDSGAVTTLARRAGLPVVAYSAGSPWGNEHTEAAELARYLGIEHVLVDLDTDELLAAIPETIRLLGTAHSDKVDIAVTAVALLRRGVITPDLVLTGYGNDLINLGLPPATTDTDALVAAVADGIDETRYSGEFSPMAAVARGKQLVHPYWHPEVLRIGLAVHPDCKLGRTGTDPARAGRDKAYFRAAMARLVPESVAWRQKIAVHHGGGLQAGLDRLFGGRPGKVEAYRECFRSIVDELRTDPLAGVDHAPAGTLLRQRAGAAARAPVTEAV